MLLSANDRLVLLVSIVLCFADIRTTPSLG